MTRTAGTILKELAPGKFQVVARVQPCGALVARRQTNDAVALFWRYSFGGMSERVPIGVYDSSAPPKSFEPTLAGFSVAAALKRAEAMAVEHYAARGKGGRPATVAAKVAADQARDLATARSSASTLERLLLAYCDHIKKLGRRAHQDARSIFRLHIFEPFPDLARRPASSLTVEEFADVMRRLHELGKTRTANKLRSYARAAYQLAKDVRSNPTIPVAFKEFGIVLNPVAETAVNALANKSAKDPLSLGEMRSYWKLIKHLAGFQGALLRLHLLSGGQRIEQLVKLKTADIKDNYFVLLDGKGRPGTVVREHAVPLTPAVRRALQQCSPTGIYALSTDGGVTHVSAATLSGWAASVAVSKIPTFATKRIRSGVETELAAAKISAEVRGRLQSHGITGVQSRHYNAYEYLDEKRAALERLRQLLESSKDAPARG